MGFFDRFTSTLDDWDFRWREAGENLGGSWDAARSFAVENYAISQNLWNTAFGGKDAKENAEAYFAAKNIWERTFDQAGRAGAVVGGPFAAAGSLPVARQTFAFADAAQHELVSRPVATANLVRSDAVNQGNLGLVFDGDTWRDAYNTTTYVTPGQALVFSTASQAQAFWGMLGVELDEIERKAILEQFPTLGIIAQDPKEFDPRNYGEGRQAYYQNDLMKGLSGTLDVGIVVLADPTIVAGKVGAAAKLRYVSKEMSAAALQRGDLDKWVTGKGYRSAKRFIEDADSSEQVRRRMFNNHYDGDMAAALLFDATRLQGEYEKTGGVVDLYDTTFRALYGDVHAWDTLAQEAAPLADVIGHQRANYTIATAARNYGTGDRAVDARVDKLVETKARAWADATVAGYGMWGKLGETARAGGMLAGTTVPRLTATSAWREGTYSVVRNKAPVTLGHWARRARTVLPSQRSGRMLDLNDANSVGVLRATLSMSRLTQEELDRWVGAYARATSPEGRFQVYNAAENFIFAKHAQHYGLTTEQLNALIPVMNRFRRGNRQILGANRRYASEDVQRTYERTLQRNRIAGAHKIESVKHRIDEAVKRGDTPAHYFTLPDEMGNLTIVPEDMNLRLDKPITVTHHADTVPMVDWHVLENALWWHTGFGQGKPATRPGESPSWAATVGKNIYSAQDFTRAALEAVMSVWKVTAILRPGYVPRTLSDEIGRVWAAQRAYSSMATMGRGVKNTAENMWARGQLLGEAITRKEIRDKAEGKLTEVEAEATDVAPRAQPATPSPSGSAPTAIPDEVLGTTEVAEIAKAVRERGVSVEDAAREATTRPLTPAEVRVLTESIDAGLSAKRTRMRLAEAAKTESRPPTRPAGSDLDFDSYERMFADGVMSVPDYVERVLAHGRAGTLNRQLAEIYDSWRVGNKDQREFVRNVVDNTLTTAGRAVYTSPSWQRELIETVIDQHTTKRKGKPAEPIVIDPLTGESPDLTSHQIEKFFVVDKRHEIKRGADGDFDVDDVYDFIADNIDVLMKPNTLLHLYVTPAGRISVGVGRSTHPTAAIKATAGVRAKLPFSTREGELLRNAGSEDVAVTTAAGRITFRAGFVGDRGDRFRAQASSRGPENAWVDAVTDTNFARWVERSQRWTDVGPDEWDRYSTSWERAARLQLGKDPIARQFLEGRSYNDVIGWLTNTNEGRAYHWRMGPWRSRYAEQVAMVQAMVDTYVPFVERRRGESTTLREKVLAGTAEVADLEAVLPRSEMPKVHGASLEYAMGRGPIMDGIKRATDKMFEMLSDKPNDKLVRHPFAAERYRAHVETLAKARGISLAKASDSFSPKDVEAIERLARSRALKDVKRYLFDTNATWDLAKSLRLFVPFGSAISDSFLKWGVVLRENPTAAINVWKLWNLPERSGLVQDEDGNQLVVEDGQEVWYQVHPETGERTRLEDHQPRDRFISFRLPSWMSERYYGEGTRPMVRINKRIFQTFLDVPTAGPMVAIPASRFSLDHPEFAENKFVKQWILPNGPTSDESAILVPANLRNIRQVILPEWSKQDRQRTEAQAISIFAAEMASHSLGQRPNAPTFEEAREKAAGMRGLRFLAAFGVGISPQIQSPYQPYVDYYRQLRLLEEDELRKRGEELGVTDASGEVPSADQLFYEEMGEEFFALTASVTRNTLGIPATIGADSAYKRYKEMIQQHPDIASLIIGDEGAGEFSRAVYEAQKTRESRPGSGEMQRERLSMEQSWKETQTRRGWLEYGRFMDLVHNDLARQGLTSLQQVGAERVKDARDKWLEERMFVESPWGEQVLNPWFQEFRSVDTSRMTSRLHSMRQIVKDRRLQGRDDIRGLIEYLRMRDRFKAYMDRAGVRSLAGEEATDLRNQWLGLVFQLKDDNLSFGALHDRWLTQDESLEAR